MIDIQAQNFSLTDAIKDHTETKLEILNNHYGEYISSIHVHLSDEHGPKDEKHCLLHVELQKLPTVVIEDTEENLYVAIDNCVHRAERAVRKTVEKKQSQARRQANH